MPTKKPSKFRAGDEVIVRGTVTIADGDERIGLDRVVVLGGHPVPVRLPLKATGRSQRSSRISWSRQTMPGGFIATLGDLRDNGMGLYAQCTAPNTGHGSRLDLDALIDRLGAEHVYINDSRLCVGAGLGGRCGHKGAWLGDGADRLDGVGAFRTSPFPSAATLLRVRVPIG